MRQCSRHYALTPLCAHVDEWLAVGMEASRAADVSVIAQTVANTCGKPCLISDSLQEAMRVAEERSDVHDLILITGSFYVVGPALDEIYSRRNRE